MHDSEMDVPRDSALIAEDLILGSDALSNAERVAKSYGSTCDPVIAYAGLVDFVDVRELDAIFPTPHSVWGVCERSDKPGEGCEHEQKQPPYLCDNVTYHCSGELDNSIRSFVADNEKDIYRESMKHRIRRRLSVVSGRGASRRGAQY